ncbi:phenylalanine--tRNA ligase subunit beta [Gemella sp. zg-1178]|uniref:phenylalanine--tRNA ligase subunit beta n=1 Tax=Gemella sp. zg-1178 TaxID=2840372 RepID=UPI001C053DD7|nr:phenylalanine--tRNA ligase subunit beta [Gemella sp. zg-1178]MBU0278682.1 phenylalanine--tRNA ligase subunit beta [Gemella sp. zg-1178]
MLLSYNWLKELIDIDDSVEKLADKITRGGLEVEELIKLDKDLSGLVVGYVKEKEKHPDAEKLNICSVDVGDEVLQIVCGATNVSKGQYVIVAKVGAKLPGLKIKKAKLRGVESQGMICSLKELGLSNSVVPKNSQEGIYVFNKPIQVGSDVIELLGLNDTIIDISITPNRADALSIRGIVYEVATLYNKKSNFKEILNNENYPATNLNIEIESENCLSYCGQIVNNIKIEESPLWLQSKLMRAGIRPINNIVDITNYVLLEYGQPMHAFDKNLLGEKILVRNAKENEKIITLDGEERELLATDLVITDGTLPVALAGVMGGADTEISEKTTSIVLESAYFSPLSVRKTSAYHNLRSESSTRFEKGIDTKLQLLALGRAVELIKELCPEASPEKIVALEKENKEKEIVVSTAYINNYIGIKLTTKEIADILLSLNFIVKINEEELIITVPTRRPDITIKQDIAEEVARLYGYDNIPSTLPKFSNSTKGGLTYKQNLVREIRKLYVNLGFSDTINYSLVSDKEASQFTLAKKEKVALLMPMSENHSTLRQTLLSGLLNTVVYNKARRNENLKLLEIGKVFFGSGDDNVQPQEELYIAGAITGKEQVTKWLKEERKIDFYDLKAYLELLFVKLGLQENISYQKANIDLMHPGRTAKVFYNDEEIGFIGEIHPTYARDLDLEETYVFEINLDKILSNDKVKPTYFEISKYPRVSRDIAMLIDEKDEFKNIEKLIKNIPNKLITNIELFDIYQGIGLPSGKKSIAITVFYNDKEKTLTEEEITKVHSQVIDELVKYGVTIR